MAQQADVVHRRVRIFYFCPWAGRLEDANAFLQRLADIDLTPRVSNPKDPELVRMARLDCDWHGEIARVFAIMSHAKIDFLPARVVGVPGMIEFAKAGRPSEEEWWLIFEGQNPQKLAGALGKLLPYFARTGIRVLYYAFDEASRTMPCFPEIAPHLSVLIHDESPLDDKARALLPKNCLKINRSWVANVVPFFVPFNPEPESKVLFLGSKLGLTDHRKRQLDYLKQQFGDRLVDIHDHSVPVSKVGQMSRYKVSFCPEGRKFATPAMSMTHTDRPFWSGCLGMVPLSEDSAGGGRLEALTEANLIVRYAHSDLDALGIACEKALSLPNDARKKIYDHFNRRETVGTVVADTIAQLA